MSEVEIGQETAESRDRLQRNAQAQKDAIAGTLKLLDQRVHQAAEWRTHIRSHPFVSVGVAIGAGVVFSRIVRHKPTPKERIFDAVAESVEGFTDSIHDQLLSRFKGSVVGGVIKAAAAAYLARLAADCVRNRTVEDSPMGIDQDQ